MIDRIFEIIIGLSFSVPLLVSILFLLKIILIRRDRNDVTLQLYIAKKVLCLFSIALAVFLLIFIVQKFIFEFTGMSGFWNVFGIVLSVLYLCGIFGLIFGLGQSGHGASPKEAMLGLYQLFYKNSEKDEKKDIRKQRG